MKPTEDEIRVSAYRMYCGRVGLGGSAEQDWLRAERELEGGGTANSSAEARNTADTTAPAKGEHVSHHLRNHHP